MASFCESNSPFLVALLVLLAINASSASLISKTNATTQNLFDDVCSEWMECPYCLEVIKTIPRAAEAPSLNALGNVILRYAFSRGKEIRSFIDSEVRSTTDPSLKEWYTSCLKNYDNALKHTKSSQDLFKSKEYLSVSTESYGGKTQVETCAKNYKPPRPSDPLKLQSFNKEFSLLCNMGFRIANNLASEA